MTGLHSYYKIATNKTLIHHYDDYVAILTLFGWSLGGNVRSFMEDGALQAYSTQINTSQFEEEYTYNGKTSEQIIKEKLDQFCAIDKDLNEVIYLMIL